MDLVVKMGNVHAVKAGPVRIAKIHRVVLGRLFLVVDAVNAWLVAVAGARQVLLGQTASQMW